MNFSSRQQQANDRELPTMWLKIQLFSRLYNAKLLHTSFQNLVPDLIFLIRFTLPISLKDNRLSSPSSRR